MERPKTEQYRLVDVDLLLDIAEKVQRIPLYLAHLSHEQKKGALASEWCATEAYKQLNAILADRDNFPRELGKLLLT
jgi:hypothetical protein